MITSHRKSASTTSVAVVSLSKEDLDGAQTDRQDKSEKRKSLKYIISHPFSLFKKADIRVKAFTDIVEQHKDFFTKYKQIDCYLVAMAFDYFQRIKPTISPTNYSSNLLFCCLYLAWETEEDSTIGVEGIIHYVVGRYPSREGKDPLQRKYEIYDWKKRLRQFHEGKDLLWKNLDFNTYVDHNKCFRVLALFPDHEIYKRSREDTELPKYFY